MKHDDARRVGDDEIKQEIAVVTSRHCRDDRSAAEGVFSCRVPVGPAIPGHIISVAGQSGPQGLCQRPTDPKRFLVSSLHLAGLERRRALLPVSLRLSPTTLPPRRRQFHGPSATTAKGPSGRKRRPLPPQLLEPPSRDTHTTSGPPRCTIHDARNCVRRQFPITTPSAPSTARPSRSKCWPIDRLHVRLPMRSSS